MQVLTQNQPESTLLLTQQDLLVQNTSDLFMTYIKALQASSNWTLKTKGKLTTFQMQIQGRIVVKGNIILNLPFDTVFNFFSDPGYSRHLTNILHSCDILHQSQSQQMKIVQMVMKFVGPISDRQMVVAHTIKHEGNKVYMGSRSCPNFPFEQHKGTILAFVYSSGFILQKLTEDKTKLTMISDYDSRGRIPDFIKRFVAGKSVGFLKDVEDHIKRVYKIK